MTIDYARALPILASLDIAETASFYIGQLGFRVEYQDSGYLIVKRDHMELHFWKAGDRKLPENTACYIRGGQVGLCMPNSRDVACPASRRSRSGRAT